MIIHEEQVNKRLVSYYQSLKGNGEIENEDSLITLLRLPLLCKYRNTKVIPLSAIEQKKKEIERTYRLVDMFR